VGRWWRFGRIGNHMLWPTHPGTPAAPTCDHSRIWNQCADSAAAQLQEAASPAAYTRLSLLCISLRGEPGGVGWVNKEGKKS
jgi:hypothetical protein